MTTTSNPFVMVSEKVPFDAVAVQTRVLEIMQKDFGFSIRDRLAVIPEVAKYKIKEDESVWNQVISGKYEYEVYFDGEFVCYFNTDQHPQRIRILILQGLKKLFLEDRIHWDPKKYEELDEIKKQEKKDRMQKFENISKKFKSPEEKLVVEAMRRNVR